jgi:integrase
MASAYVNRVERDGTVRYRVRYRLGGAESTNRHGGSFRTMREARIRRDWIAGLLAAGRVPDLKLGPEIETRQTLRQVAEQWRASRVDVADGTAATHRVNLGRILPRLGDRSLDAIAPTDVIALIAELHEAGLRRESIRKTISTLTQVFDFAKVEPNPTRDRTVKLPRELRPEVNPPSAEHVEAVYHLLPSAYRLPLLVLDATGMRVGELEGLTWDDVDEPKRRWRVSRIVAKTGRARWVDVPVEIFEAVCALVPREDRVPARPVFQGFGADRFRTAISRACRAAGVPTFSPHDLRHRRISLWHRDGREWAWIGARVGQRSLSVTADTYTHVLTDGREVDHAELIARSRDDAAAVGLTLDAC